ncbi:MAG TPA: TonB-dependent receptor [Candidatus Eisenbacteria bacterium]
MSRGIALFRSGLAILIVLLAGLSLANLAHAAAAGTITGIVVGPSGQPESQAIVQVEGSTPPLGAPTDAAGNFTIRNVPVGTYRLLVKKFGFQDLIRPNVVISANQTTTIKFELKETVATEIDEVNVTGARTRMERESSTTKQKIGKEDLESLPVDTYQEAVALKAGVVSQAGELHFRGGRSGEVAYMIDGIRVSDPLAGGGLDIATNAVAESEILLGGFDAEYGNAQSGVINISTQEGGASFSGAVEYSTDDFGAPDKTYNNFDRLNVGFGGPTGVKDLTYFFSFQGTFSDGYLKTNEVRPRQTILDFIRVGPRQNNDFNYQGKLAWRPAPSTKLTLEYLNNHSVRDIYTHIFSLNGFVQTRVDTIRATGQIVTRYGRFSAESEDSTFVPYNASEHTPNVEDNFNQVKLVWNHTLSPATFYTVKVSRYAFDYDYRVKEQEPWEYNGRYPDQWRNAIDFTTSRFFATNGDYPQFADRNTQTFSFKTDWTHQVGRHKFKSGIEGVYNDLSLLSIDFPVSVNANGQVGGFRSQYHYFNNEGAFYLQDRWDHEGMVINVGGRVDVFSVGDQLGVSEVQDRSRNQFSPRVGIAYPVSDRDVFSFHYGRFSQIPDRQYIFENRGAATQVRGNPNLENETTVSYQAGLQHMFTQDIFGQFSVYFKDIFGLLTIEQLSSGDNPNLVPTYVNRDYASARGFELSLEKRFSHNFSGGVSYGYGVATGVASDPNLQRNEELLYLPISEQPLDWDQRHTFSAQVLLSQPAEWAVNMVWSYGSGFPYTPTSRNERKVDPSLANAARLPSTTKLDIQAEKHFSIYNQDVKVFFRGNNVLDARNLNDLEPSNWPNPPGTNTNDYRVFYTETGRAGGAYLGDDVNGDATEDWIPVNDPRVFTEGRNLRLGVGVKF